MKCCNLLAGPRSDFSLYLPKVKLRATLDRASRKRDRRYWSQLIEEVAGVAGKPRSLSFSKCQIQIGQLRYGAHAVRRACADRAVRTVRGRRAVIPWAPARRGDRPFGAFLARGLSPSIWWVTPPSVAVLVCIVAIRKPPISSKNSIIVGSWFLLLAHHLWQSTLCFRVTRAAAYCVRNSGTSGCCAEV